MALNWMWNNKVGEMVIQQDIDNNVREFTMNLYQGNAYLIMIYEWKENDEDMYNVHGFFTDKNHMKNCLGLNKKGGYTTNIYNKQYEKMKKIRINKAKYSYTKELVTALVQAFDELEIEIYSEE